MTNLTTPDHEVLAAAFFPEGFPPVATQEEITDWTEQDHAEFYNEHYQGA